MIDAKTLQIGSHVLCNGKRERVRGLDEDNGLIIRFPAEYVHASEVEPILITGILLKELGFDKREWSDERVYVKQIGEYAMRLIYMGSNEWDCYIHTSHYSCRLAMYRKLLYLHELETIFYLITKTRLIED